jgi:hypothetical protein
VFEFPLVGVVITNGGDWSAGDVPITSNKSQLLAYGMPTS